MRSASGVLNITGSTILGIGGRDCRPVSGRRLFRSATLSMGWLTAVASQPNHCHDQHEDRLRRASHDTPLGQSSMMIPEDLIVDLG